MLLLFFIVHLQLGTLSEMRGASEDSTNKQLPGMTRSGLCQDLSTVYNGRDIGLIGGTRHTQASKDDVALCEFPGHMMARLEPPGHVRVMPSLRCRRP